MQDKKIYLHSTISEIFGESIANYYILGESKETGGLVGEKKGGGEVINHITPFKLEAGSNILMHGSFTSRILYLCRKV